MIYLSPKFWAAIALAIGLAISHWWVYDLGKTKTQAQWQKDVAQRTIKALQAEQAARKREQDLAAERQKLEEKYVNDKKRAAVAAAGAQSELDRLRNEIRAAAGRAACQDPGSPARANGAVVATELLGECATALLDMGKEADRLKSIVGGLQNYARAVCLAR